MAINFPDSPSNGDTFTANSIVYTYNASTTLWDTISAAGSAIDLSAVNEAIIPDTDVTYDLGSSTYRWKDLYLSGSTLHLGASATISAGSGSEIVLPSIKVGSGSNAVKLSASASGGLQTQAVVGGVSQPVQPAGGTVQVADLAAMQAIASPAIGAMVSVVANKTIYMYNGTGFYKIAVMVNESPSAITGVNGEYALASDGTATTITAIATDPEGRPLTWSYAVSSGALNGTTVVQGPGDSTGPDTNVFTITPHASNSTTFSITFSVTDNVNGAVNAVSAFTLAFIVQNSRYTALSVKATATGSNQTFDDASTSNNTITASGDTTASTFSPHRHGGHSLGLDGTNDYLQVPQTTDLDLTGDFTVEMWVYLNELKNQGLISKWSGAGLFGWTLYNSGSALVFIASSGSGAGTSTNFSQAPVTNQWMHLAISRTSGTISTYINGTRTNTNTSNENCTANTELTIGSDGSALSSWSLNGYMRDVRIVNGTGLYTGASFTVPTEPLTAITNTKFLLGDLPYFKDQSTSNGTITVGGNASLKPISLFDNDPYSKSSHGASAYFDGTGDYLTGASSATIGIGTGDFTIECWFYATDGTSVDRGIWETRTDGYPNWSDGLSLTRLTETTFRLYGSSALIVSSATTITNNWNHLAVVRNSGTLKFFVNGVSQGTVSNSTNMNSAQPIVIGSGRYTTSNSTPTHAVKGYIQDFRVVIGTAVYTSAFTPPTEPLTAITNTKFLLNPETSISDLSQSSAITCIADAATSTTQVKFAGTKSIYLDGTGDFLQSSESVNIAGDWTIEGWYYFTTLAADHSFFTIGDSASQTNSMEFLYRGASINELRFYNMGSGYSNQHTPPSDFLANNWIHIAVVRSGTGTNNIKAYINGTQSGTGKTSNNDLIGKVNIGTELYNGAGGWFTQGYIQDFRVSSIARYTANFTPPTAELQG